MGTTGGDHPRNFLIHDSGVQSADRVVVFATDEALQHLGRADEWYVDGTFTCAPKLFQQLYVIRALLEDTSVTICLHDGEITSPVRRTFPRRGQ